MHGWSEGEVQRHHSPGARLNQLMRIVREATTVTAHAGDGLVDASMDLHDCDVPNQMMTEFQLHWKSGDQEYDGARQLSLTQDAETGATFVRLAIEGLTNGTEYTVRARTVNEFGRGAWSDQLDFAHIVKATPTDRDARRLKPRPAGRTSGDGAARDHRLHRRRGHLRLRREEAVELNHHHGPGPGVGQPGKG